MHYIHIEETPDANISDISNELRQFLVHNCFYILDKTKRMLISYPFRSLLGFILFHKAINPIRPREGGELRDPDNQTHSCQSGTSQSPFTKLWQSCSDPHLKICPIAIFAFYYLNYSLAARLQDNSRPKSPTKVKTKRKLQQFTVSGRLILNREGSRNGKKGNFKVEIILNMKRQYNY